MRQVGGDIKGIQPGDAVIASFNSCGRCDPCSREVPAYCRNFVRLNFGGSRLDQSVTMSTSNHEPLHGNFFGQSSFCSFALVNARCLVKIPRESPLALYAPLGCAIQTGAGALLNTLNMRRGASVAVFGTGSVGMAAVMAAKILDASIIIGIDIDEGRLEIAKSLGATHTLKGSDPDIVDQVRALCDGDGVQYAVDCTGIPAMVERMVEALGNTGKAATIGAAPPGTMASIDIFQHITRGKQYIGCNLGDSVPQQVCDVVQVFGETLTCSIRQMVAFLIEQHSLGNLPLERIVKLYNVDDWELALDDMHSGKVIKPVLVWQELDEINKSHRAF